MQNREQHWSATGNPDPSGLAARSGMLAVPGCPADPVDGDTLFRATQRIPRLGDTGADADTRATAVVGGAPPPPPTQGPVADSPAARPTDPVRRSLIPVLGIALACLGAVIAVPVLGLAPGAPSMPTAASRPVASTVAAPAPTVVIAVPRTAAATAGDAVPPPPVQQVPQPVVTITETVEVAPPETTADETPTPSPTELAVRPSPTASASPTLGAGTPGAAFPIATWTYGLDGLGPVRLGTTTAAAVTAGYLVPDPADPSGYATAPALGPGVRLWVAGGAIQAITITDPTIRSAAGVGPGSSLLALQAAYGGALVSLPAVDTAGASLTLPGLDGPTTFVAFQPASTVVGEVVVGLKQAGVVTIPAPTAAATPTPTASVTASPSPTPSATPSATVPTLSGA